jgi:hypothetical protein
VGLLCRDLAAQPSKLNEFIAFRLRVREVQAARDRVSGLRPAQVQDLYATATSWGGRLPHMDQVCAYNDALCGIGIAAAAMIQAERCMLSRDVLNAAQRMASCMPLPPAREGGCHTETMCVLLYTAATLDDAL